jgi:4-amino-4-deoxychorismate lyase
MWLKYPNPISSHVLAADVVSRIVDSSGRLVTTRILLKTASVPVWAQRVRTPIFVYFPWFLLCVSLLLSANFQFLPTSEAYIIEESLVDPSKSAMTTKTRNISHTRILSIEECQLISRDPTNGIKYA